MLLWFKSWTCIGVCRDKLSIHQTTDVDCHSIVHTSLLTNDGIIGGHRCNSRLAGYIMSLQSVHLWWQKCTFVTANTYLWQQLYVCDHKSVGVTTKHLQWQNWQAICSHKGNLCCQIQYDYRGRTLLLQQCTSTDHVDCRVDCTASDLMLKDMSLIFRRSAKCDGCAVADLPRRHSSHPSGQACERVADAGQEEHHQVCCQPATGGHCPHRRRARLLWDGPGQLKLLSLALRCVLYSCVCLVWSILKANWFGFVCIWSVRIRTGIHCLINGIHFLNKRLMFCSHVCPGAPFMWKWVAGKWD